MTADGLQEFARIGGNHARLLRFAADIDLEQDIHYPSGPVLLEKELEAITDLRTIHRVNHIKDLEGSSGFVPLQRPDEVPPGRTNRWFFSLRLLDAVFSEISSAGDYDLIDNLGRMRLGYRNQGHFVRIAASDLGGRDDPAAHRRQASR